MLPSSVPRRTKNLFLVNSFLLLPQIPNEKIPPPAPTNFMLFTFCLLPVSHPNGLLASTDCIKTCSLGNLVGFKLMSLIHSCLYFLQASLWLPLYHLIWICCVPNIPYMPKWLISSSFHRTFTASHVLEFWVLCWKESSSWNKLIHISKRLIST